MKIAVITFTGKLSGLAQYSYELAKEIACLNGSCDLTTNDHFQPGEIARGVDFQYVFRRTRHLPADLPRFLFHILRKEYDILHFQNYIKNVTLTIILLAALRFAGFRIVYTAHDILPHYPSCFDRHLFRILYSLPHGIIVHSEENRLALEEIGGKRAVSRPVGVIPHGLFEKYAKDRISTGDAKQALGIPKDRIVILYFGNIEKRKGAELLLSLAPRFVRNNPNVLFLFAGKDTYPPGHLESMARATGVEDHFAFHTGMVPDELVGRYFSAADAVALTYLEGSTSGVMKVAFSFGKFVIVTNVGELPSAVNDYGHGIVVGPDMDETLADKIISLAVGVGSKPNEMYLTRCSWQRCAEKTFELYRNCLR